MADGNNKVFVSPGVYTAEKDLTFVAQSVGVTTMGIAGETLKGPAFEPIFINSWNEFRTRFGDTDSDKFINTQIPKYETGYIAKSYLNQSNQLFVTRVLGKSGYDAGPSWSITTIGEIDPCSVYSGTTGQGPTVAADFPGTGTETYNANNTDAFYYWGLAAAGDDPGLQWYVPLTATSINASSLYRSANTSSDAVDGSVLQSFSNRLINQADGNIFQDTTWPYDGEPYKVTGNTLYNCQGTSLGSFLDDIAHWVYKGLMGGSVNNFYASGANDYYYWGFVPSAATVSATTDIVNWTGQQPQKSNRLGITLTTGNTSSCVEFSADCQDGWYRSLFDYKYSVDDCRVSCYSGNSFALWAHSAHTATTYIEEVVTTSSGLSGTQEYFMGGITGLTSASTYTEWIIENSGSTAYGLTNIPSNYCYVSCDSSTYNNSCSSAATSGVCCGDISSFVKVNYAQRIPGDGYFGCSGNTPYTASSACLSGWTSIGTPDPISEIPADTGKWNSALSGGAIWTGSAYTIVSIYTASCREVKYLTIMPTGASFTWGCVSAQTEFDDLVVGTLRSRGESTLSTGGPAYDISGNSVGNVVMDCSGVYEEIMADPFAEFGVSARTDTGIVYKFTTSFDTGKKSYIKKVLGVNVFDKNRYDVPIFIEEAYPNLLKYLYNRQKIRGLNCCFCHLPAARFNNVTRTSIGWYMTKWQTPSTPWLVSEIRGQGPTGTNTVFPLFKFISISDGSAANREIKLSITNISFERKEFDILVRQFNDTDASPIVLEKYTRCTMNPQLVNFVGRKIGTSDGEYELKSRYIMLYIHEDVLVEGSTQTEALPCGFEGYKFRNYCTSAKNPNLQFKTKYFTPGETVYDPPFSSAGGVSNAFISAGDNIRRTYLGVSTSEGAAIDNDFFDFKGYITPNSVCTNTTGTDWPTLTSGFHMDSGATTIIAGSGNYLTYTSTTLSGKAMFQAGVVEFRKEPTSTTDPYYKMQARKFTLAPHGGFDGWDEYRESRTIGDNYRLGMSGFLNGACTDTTFPDAVGQGSFKAIGSTEANTDWYAYQEAIRTYENPEAVDINIFTTPGIDYVNNLGLVNDAIEMIEADRADSLYVVTTPDYNLFVPTTSDATNMISPTEAVNNLDDSFIDSNYTATYYPWIQIRDANTNKQIYIPPTAEVVRNLALTDNIAFPWFASAGYTRGIVNAIKARKKLTLDERDTLYIGRLNPIATYSDTGPIIWGNKTLQIRESALDRINVRRLLLQARKLISAVAVRLLFEQNDDIVRQQFLDLVNPILDSIRRDRGLTDFRVVLSDDPEEIDRNEMNGKIYIKPTRALEFIYIEFLITPTGASFEDV